MPRSNSKTHETRFAYSREIAQVVRQIREKNRLSQVYMAAHMQISDSGYVQLENKDYGWTVGYLIAAAAALDCDPCEILKQAVSLYKEKNPTWAGNDYVK